MLKLDLSDGIQSLAAVGQAGKKKQIEITHNHFYFELQQRFFVCRLSSADVCSYHSEIYCSFVDLAN